MSYAIVTPATEKPLTSAELKAHLRVLHDLDDTYIDTLQNAAIEEIEIYTDRQLLPATWVLLLDSFSDEIEITEKLPLVSITSVKYYDLNNELQTVNADNYTLEKRTNPAILKINPDKDWPSTYSKKNAVEITFQSGYADKTKVPEAIKHAIKLMVGNLYTYRDDLQKKTGLTTTSEILLAPYKKPGI